MCGIGFENENFVKEKVHLFCSICSWWYYVHCEYHVYSFGNREDGNKLKKLKKGRTKGCHAFTVVRF